MTNLWKGMIGAGLFAAVVLYLTFQDKEEIKAEIKIEKLEQKLSDQKFDDEFSDAWNGEAGSKIKKLRAENIESIKAEIETAKKHMAGMDAFDKEFLDSGREALIEEDARLSMSPEKF